jgi:general secretion pathway protein I
LKTRQVGFTLIEIVVAFVMLALVLGVSYEVFSTGFRRAGDLEDYSRALAIAQSQLDQASVGDTFQEGQTSGESADHRFRWTTTISAFETNPDPSKQVLASYFPVHVAVRVTWRSGGERERQVDLATLVVGHT